MKLWNLNTCEAFSGDFYNFRKQDYLQRYWAVIEASWRLKSRQNSDFELNLANFEEIVYLTIAFANSTATRFMFSPLMCFSFSRAVNVNTKSSSIAFRLISTLNHRSELRTFVWPAIEMVTSNNFLEFGFRVKNVFLSNKLPMSFWLIRRSIHSNNNKIDKFSAEISALFN